MYVQFVPLQETAVEKVSTNPEQIFTTALNQIFEIFLYKSESDSPTLCVSEISYLTKIFSKDAKHITHQGILHHLRGKIALEIMSWISSDFVFDILMQHLQNRVISVAFRNYTVEFLAKFTDNIPFDYKIIDKVYYYCNFSMNMTDIFDNPLNFSTYWSDNIMDSSFPAVHFCFPYWNCLSNREQFTKHVDFRSITPCSKIELRYSDYLWHANEDNTITLNDFTFDTDTFYVVHYDYDSAVVTDIAVCIDEYERYTAFVSQLATATVEINAELIVSFICSGLSITALTLTLLAFCVMSELRKSLPGINNMTLVTYLLFAHIFYIVSNTQMFETESLACQLVGCLVHLFWLLSILWMNICTFHLAVVISKFEIVSRSFSFTKYFLYHAYAFAITTIFMLVNAVFSSHKYGTIGYGRRSCYVSYPEMVLFTFALPTSLVIVTNFFMFCYVIFKVKRSSVRKNVQRGRSDLMIFVKISSITGIAWVVGIINIWLNLSVLDYVFSVTNASQGVFVFLSFVVNRRVKELLTMALTRSNSGQSSRKEHNSCNKNYPFCGKIE